MAEIIEKFSLPNVKVEVRPVLREGIWLERGHSGHWQYDNCFFGITVPIDSQTGYLKEVLTPSERMFFENSDLSGLDFKPGDLMATKKEKNFWKNFTIPIQKPESIVGDETIIMTLDLSNPFDYIKYAVFRANTSPSGGSVAPSWNERYNSGTYKVALVKDEETIGDVVQKSEKKQKAYKHLTSIQKSVNDMYDFLSIYWLSSKSYTQPPKDSNKEFYTAECEKIIEKDLDGFVAVVEDSENYPYKIMLHKAVRLNFLSYSLSTGFVTVEGVPLGLTMNDAVAFLKNPKNQEHYMRLENYVQNNIK